jgi:hypothetical protein
MLPTDLARPTLFVHIGTHKTGTTSIQNFLRAHASSLRLCGIFVPTAGTLNHVSGHHNIAWQARNDPRYRTHAGGIDELIAELKCSQANTAVVSSEDFEYLLQYPRELRAFDELLEKAGFTTKYLVYFREVEGYARSLFCELESGKDWADADYDAFRKSIQSQGFVRTNGDWHYEFRYELFVEKWQAILGRKIHKYSYDEAVRGVGLLPSFLMTIGASQTIVDESFNAPMLNTMFDKYQRLAIELNTVFDKYQRLEIELMAIKSSTSWRLTAPLRNTVDCCRRVLRRLTIISTDVKAFIVQRWFAMAPADTGRQQNYRAAGSGRLPLEVGLFSALAARAAVDDCRRSPALAPLPDDCRQTVRVSRTGTSGTVQEAGKRSSFEN